ncbi:DUF4442 domain-containing protein [Ornithinimicrobium kibberense]|uniref:DUF4442 domain-containing protein n=2 Tax=Ornithinimicrobium kibberense TaxID=282060 RepID=A0ABV5V0J0_9MICO|nr:DUF4442 domain-containing protein [Ornithinimicrobium kibberense]
MSGPAAPRAGSRSAQRVGPVKALARDPRVLRVGMNAWPPFLFSGIHVQHIAEDFREVAVRLRHTPLTSNYVGTQFGGSIFAMCDPFWMLMVMRNLGRGYVVWDRAAEVEFLAPGRGPVGTTFHLTQEVLDELQVRADDGDRVLRWFDNEVVADDGTLVARVRKQVYVRRARG